MKIFILFLLLMVLFVFLSCSKPNIIGKWQLFYFGESADCRSMAIAYDPNGLEQGSYREFKPDGTLIDFSSIENSIQTTKWKAEGNGFWIEKKGVSFKPQDSIIEEYELLKEVTPDRMLVYYQAYENAPFIFCWKKLE